MPIPLEHRHRSVYHFTHIDNLPRILKHGFCANTHESFVSEECRSIAETGIQARRAEMDVPCGPGGKVHDYVPLYFGSLSPMLLGVINKKNVDQFDILYFEFPIQILNDETVVFTDASANTSVLPRFYTDPSYLGNLNWAEIDSLKWTSRTPDLRHQRMAEILVHSELAVLRASRVVVWNEWTKGRVEKIVEALGMDFPPIEMEDPRRRHWFRDFTSNTGRKNASLVKGPREIQSEFEIAFRCIKQGKNSNPEAEFATPKALLEALRSNFGALPETRELVGLQSANAIHHETVDQHTLEVVAKLRVLPEFKSLEAALQDRIELAAFLHDIGKGPRSRWEDGVQKVDPDHPSRALPMMVRILTESIAKVSTENARFLLKLVCFHDLVGEVLGKERDMRQIIEITETPSDLDGLFALGKADARSLVERWFRDAPAKDLYDECLRGLQTKLKEKDA